MYEGSGSDDLDLIGVAGDAIWVPEEKGGLPGKPGLGGRQVPDGNGGTVKVPQTSEPYLESLLPDKLKDPAVLARIRAINPALADKIEAGQTVPVVSEVVKADTNGRVTVYQTRPRPAQSPDVDPDVETNPGDTPAGDIVSALHGLISSFYLIPPPIPPTTPAAARLHDISAITAPAPARPWTDDIAHSALNALNGLADLAAAVTAPTGPLPRPLFTRSRQPTDESLTVNITPAPPSNHHSPPRTADAPTPQSRTCDLTITEHAVAITRRSCRAPKARQDGPGILKEAGRLIRCPEGMIDLVTRSASTSASQRRSDGGNV
ncbi:hypothetical protein ACW2Q0_12325 [Nocardia sp. R16R-3T]